MKIIHRLAPALPVAALALLATPAHAYIGPGVGMGVIGTVFGIVATLALAVFGFLWYPLKRLLAKRRGKGAATTTAPAARTAAAPAPGGTPAAPAAAPAELATGPADIASSATTGPDDLAPTSVRAPVAGADVRESHVEKA